jgi:hypothetical protein
MGAGHGRWPGWNVSRDGPVRYLKPHRVPKLRAVSLSPSPRSRRPGHPTERRGARRLPGCRHGFGCGWNAGAALPRRVWFHGSHARSWRVARRHRWLGGRRPDVSGPGEVSGNGRGTGSGQARPLGLEGKAHRLSKNRLRGAFGLPQSAGSPDPGLCRRLEIPMKADMCQYALHHGTQWDLNFDLQRRLCRRRADARMRCTVTRRCCTTAGMR